MDSSDWIALIALIFSGIALAVSVPAEWLRRKLLFAGQKPNIRIYYVERWIHPTNMKKLLIIRNEGGSIARDIQVEPDTNQFNLIDVNDMLPYTVLHPGERFELRGDFTQPRLGRAGVTLRYTDDAGKKYTCWHTISLRKDLVTD